MKTRDDINSICNVVRSHSSFFLTSHINPEGDAIGSVLGLALALKKLGKFVYVMNQDPVPHYLKFLEGIDLIKQIAPDRSYEVGILLDCSNPGRTGVAGDHVGKCRKIICIDHHATNGGFGDYSYIDPNASSTGELVYHILRALDVEITAEIATPLWVAILTDTGCFRYSNVTGDSMKTAGELLERGANPCAISENLYENEPKEKLDLLSLVLSTLEVTCEGKVASITVHKKDMKKAGASYDLLEGFINYPRSIGGVSVAVSFREEGDSKYKVSLRGKGNTDVATVAESFGGGGHLKASGFMIEGDFTKVKKEVYGKIMEMLEERV